MKDNDPGVKRFIELVKPIFKAVFNIEPDDNDLTTIYGQAISCAFPDSSSDMRTREYLSRTLTKHGVRKKKIPKIVNDLMGV